MLRIWIIILIHIGTRDMKILLVGKSQLNYWGSSKLDQLFPFKVGEAETYEILNVLGKFYRDIKVIGYNCKYDGFVIASEGIAAKTPNGGQVTGFCPYLSFCSCILKTSAQGAINTGDRQGIIEWYEVLTFKHISEQGNKVPWRDKI